MEILGILDIGSNSMRLNIWRINDAGAYSLMGQAKEHARMGEGMSVDNRLTCEAMERGLDILDNFVAMLASYKVTKTVAVATEAIRRAKNGPEFIRMVKERSGIDLRVIGGDEEGRLSVAGVQNTIALNDFVMMDTGGASCEVALVRNRKCVGVTSIPFGSITLHERWLGTERKPSPERLLSLEDAIAKQFESIEFLGFPSRRIPPMPLVIVGGSNRALGKMHAARMSWPFDTVHGMSMEPKTALRLIDDLGRMSVDERRDIPGLDKDRADIIMGGLTPLKVLMKLVGSDEIIVSTSGVREGLLFRYLLGEQGGAYPVLKDVTEHSIVNLLGFLGGSITHALNMRSLALALYEQLLPVHRLCDPAWRSLLASAATLHDIGLSINYDEHEEHGAYIVMNAALYGMTPRERVLCALLVGMHRMNEIRAATDKYAAFLREGDALAVSKLAPLLKLAEEINRMCYGRCASVKCAVGERVELILEDETGYVLDIHERKKLDKVVESLIGDGR